jgi:hypothetical protein
MGEAADGKVAAKLTEMEETRRRLEGDLSELEQRIPSALRSAKSLIGLVVGSTAVSLMILQRLRPRRKERPQEVVIRVVREDR